MPSLKQVQRDVQGKGRRRDALILLVGRNPIPNFVAAVVLQPRTLYVVFTNDTRDVKVRLARTLKACIKDWRPSDAPDDCFVDVHLTDACDIDEVRRVFRDYLPGEIALHYTGGTKTMAAHVYHLWLTEKKGDPRFASYLDEASGSIRFDDGLTVDVDGATPSSVEILADLHGLRDFKAQYLPGMLPSGLPSVNDAVTITKMAASDPNGIPLITNGLRRLLKEPSSSHDVAQPALDAFARLSYQSLSSEMRTEKLTQEWDAFIAYNSWLEVFAASCVAEASRDCESEGSVQGETVWNVRGRTVGGRDFQVDVAHCRGHRLYALSCTTSKPSNDALYKAKNKLFEVSFRAKQLGGDLARSALVCFLGSTLEKGTNRVIDQVSELQADVVAAYGSCDDTGYRLVPHVPRVFGSKHIRAWLEGDLSSLKEWLRA
ncbi:MAG: hypothetical protein AB1700_05355 [Bacillota bacterium]